MRACSDHFQPPNRLHFALMSGGKDGLFWEPAATKCALVNFTVGPSYANVGIYRIQKGNDGSSHTLSATKS
jgi:hypothetical protein